MKIQIKFEPRDLWIGLYWIFITDTRLNLYFCLIPCLPIVLTITLPHEAMWEVVILEDQNQLNSIRAIANLAGSRSWNVAFNPDRQDYSAYSFDFRNEQAATHFSWLLNAIGVKSIAQEGMPF